MAIECDEPICVEAVADDGGSLWVEVTGNTRSESHALTRHRAVWASYGITDDVGSYCFSGQVRMRVVDLDDRAASDPLLRHDLGFAHEPVWIECAPRARDARRFWKFEPARVTRARAGHGNPCPRRD